MDRIEIDLSLRIFRGAFRICHPVLLVFLIFPLLLSCSLFGKNKLETVKSAGELIVLTRTGPTTYYETPDGPAGPEYDLVKSFAHYLGVKPRFIVAGKFSEIIPRLIRGEADMAAAGITVTEARRKIIQFGPSYQEIRQQVIYGAGNSWPERIEDLIGRQIEVQSGTSYAEHLHELQQQFPGLKWTEVNKETEELLQMTWEGLLEISVADSNIVAINRQYFPELRVAFDLQKPESLAWAFPLGRDRSLLDAAETFMEKFRASGELAQWLDRYYGPASQSNFVNLSVFKVRLISRLAQYQLLFEDAARRNHLDWRLLAALGYQESYWDPLAKSPTGVRGMMMLTEETATQYGIADRLDAAQSIDGGARYLRSLIDRIPPGVAEPDRTWMALAAYNIGMGHLEDARVITQKQEGDPNKWNEVKTNLPLLSETEWYTKTKNGYARGLEPVLFVNSVRTYFDVLLKTDEEEQKNKKSQVFNLKTPAI